MAREMTKSRATGFKDCYTTVLLPSYVKSNILDLSNPPKHIVSQGTWQVWPASPMFAHGEEAKKETFVPCRLLTSRFIFGICPSIQSTPIRPDMMKPTRNLQPARGVTQQTGRGSPTPMANNTNKSAHTALAVKACLLGGNSYTKCSITFVNIAVAISALAGGAKTVSHRDQNTVVFSTFFEDFWVTERKRVLKWNFGSFW